MRGVWLVTMVWCVATPLGCDGAVRAIPAQVSRGGARPASVFVELRLVAQEESDAPGSNSDRGEPSRLLLASNALITNRDFRQPSPARALGRSNVYARLRQDSWRRVAATVRAAAAQGQRVAVLLDGQVVEARPITEVFWKDGRAVWLPVPGSADPTTDAARKLVERIETSARGIQ